MVFLNRTTITISILPKIQARVSRSCSTPTLLRTYWF